MSIVCWRTASPGWQDWQHGHVYARRLRALRTNPLGEKQQKKNQNTWLGWSRRFKLELRQYKHQTSRGMRSDPFSNAISDVTSAIKLCRLVRQRRGEKRIISHLLSTCSPCIYVPQLSSSDMLSICVCLCALFTHVLSREAEEPISYTVSQPFVFNKQNVFKNIFSKHLLYLNISDLMIQGHTVHQWV